MSRKPLWFGKSVLTKRVFSKRQTFNQFAKSLKEPSRLELTMEQFHALGKGEKLNLKDGLYFTGCSFTDARRTDVLSDKVNLICIDIDDGDHSHFVEALPLTLEEFNWVAYTTLSSTPEAPRWRVVVEADGKVDTVYYSAMVATVGEAIGLPHVTTESRVISQPMFMPKAASDAEYKLMTHLKGRAFAFEDIGDDLPTSTPTSKGKSTGGDDALLYMAAPLDDVGTAIISEALEAIDPDCGRLEWIRLCCAVKHQYQGSEEGFELFHEWSARGEKYQGYDDVRRQWDYEEANPGDRNPVTIKTLFHLAKEAGWEETVEGDLLDDLLATVAAATDRDDLLSTIPQHISQSRLSPPAREMLVTALRDRIREVTGSTVSIAKVRSWCRFRAADVDVYETTDGAMVNGGRQVPPWAENMCYVQATNEFYDTATGTRMKPEVMDHSFGKFLLTRQEVAEGQSAPNTRPRNFLLNVCHIPQYWSYVYLPWLEDSVSTQLDGMPMVNTYRDLRPIMNPLKTKKDKKEYQLVEHRLMEHLEMLLGDKERQIFMDFLAYNVQNPGAKMTWCIVIQSVQGTGKTFFAQVMAAVMGGSNVGCPDHLTLSKDYTEWAEGKQMVFVEEIRCSGKNRFEMMDKLKPFITNDMVTINRKMVSSYPIPNVTNYVMFSNHKDAIALDDNDRRYCFMMSPLQRKGQVPKSNYFVRLFEILKYPGSLRRLFEDWEISRDFDPKGRAPETVANRLAIEMSRSSLDHSIQELIDEDIPGINAEIISSKLVHDYLSNGTFGTAVKVGRRELTHQLIGSGYIRLERRCKVHGQMHTVWAHDTLCEVMSDLEIISLFRKDMKRVISKEFD